ncbi:isochorismatase family protein [Reyranella sp.]|uniref:isochorismatase family protein n=1 Tax=Reyranella sp. TaxID=1929291 RepID=UPI0037846961
MRHALIVIDMQQGPFGGSPPWHDVTGLIGRMNRLANAVRSTGTVVFIQHDEPPGDPYHPDSPGSRFLSALDVRPADAVIHKQACDSFLDTPARGVPACAIDRPADHHRAGCYPPNRRLAGAARACLTSRFSDNKMGGRAEVAPSSRHRRSCA